MRIISYLASSSLLLFVSAYVFSELSEEQKSSLAKPTCHQFSSDMFVCMDALLDFNRSSEWSKIADWVDRSNFGGSHPPGVNSLMQTRRFDANAGQAALNTMNICCDELWMAFIWSGKEAPMEPINAERDWKNIEMIMTVTTKKPFLYTWHMGICRNFYLQYTDTPLHRQASMLLHTYAAHIMKQFHPQLYYVRSNLLQTMANLMRYSLGPYLGKRVFLVPHGLFETDNQPLVEFNETKGTVSLKALNDTDVLWRGPIREFNWGRESRGDEFFLADINLLDELCLKSMEVSKKALVVDTFNWKDDELKERIKNVCFQLQGATDCRINDEFKGIVNEELKNEALRIRHELGHRIRNKSPFSHHFDNLSQQMLYAICNRFPSVKCIDEDIRLSPDGCCLYVEKLLKPYRINDFEVGNLQFKLAGKPFYAAVDRRTGIKVSISKVRLPKNASTATISKEYTARYHTDHLIKYREHFWPSEDSLWIVYEDLSSYRLLDNCHGSNEGEDICIAKTIEILLPEVESLCQQDFYPDISFSSMLINQDNDHIKFLEKSALSISRCSKLMDVFLHTWLRKDNEIFYTMNAPVARRFLIAYYSTSKADSNSISSLPYLDGWKEAKEIIGRILKDHAHDPSEYDQYLAVSNEMRKQFKNSLKSGEANLENVCNFLVGNPECTPIHPFAAHFIHPQLKLGSYLACVSLTFVESRPAVQSLIGATNFSTSEYENFSTLQIESNFEKMVADLWTVVKNDIAVLPVFKNSFHDDDFLEAKSEKKYSLELIIESILHLRIAAIFMNGGEDKMVSDLSNLFAEVYKELENRLLADPTDQNVVCTLLTGNRRCKAPTGFFVLDDLFPKSNPKVVAAVKKFENDEILEFDVENFLLRNEISNDK